MADNGPATGTPELNVSGGYPTSVFQEIHSQNNVVSAITSGVPGGLSGPASGNNQLAPADFSGSSAQAYGTVSSGSAVTPVFNAGGTSASFGPNNPSGSGNLNLFRFKNPAAFAEIDFKEIF